jgi:hypothetical protein
MSIRGQRLVVLASAALWLVVLLVVFSLRAGVSHSYSHTIGSPQVALPWLTRNVAIPILGGDAAHGEGRLLFALIWGMLFAFPIAGAWWSCSGEMGEGERPLLRWSALTTLFLPLLALVATAVAVGLWLPRALLAGPEAGSSVPIVGPSGAAADSAPPP